MRNLEWVSAARNKGIERVSEGICYFCDSDGLVRKKMLYLFNGSGK